MPRNRKTREHKDTGDPYINTALTILGEAKKDAKLWLDFKAEFGDNSNVESLVVAQWVSNWLVKNPSTVDYKDIDRLGKGLKGEGNDR